MKTIQKTNPILQIKLDEVLLREMIFDAAKAILDKHEIGCWWDLKRLEIETCRKRDWLLEHILLNPNYKEEMKLITNGRDGGRWMIRGSEMKVFLDKHFHQLNRSKHRNVSNKKGETV
ncbi:phage pi2 protein 07 [Paenibacillus sp. 1182]|uniref:DUF771 domain-containing protein n=1 Tax=Paenibacillus sp. 1182 TaxID=2806565 RepID=UPI001AE8B55C|nr:DUF771 domain-containing protein [Paenibacillus sp. 1182]MBP1312275.1 phage pi2 protein 07 [Paenibacillus sp. 1182]